MQGTKISLKTANIFTEEKRPLDKPLLWIKVLVLSSFATCVAMPLSGFRPPSVHLSRQKSTKPGQKVYLFSMESLQEEESPLGMFIIPIN